MNREACRRLMRMTMERAGSRGGRKRGCESLEVQKNLMPSSCDGLGSGGFLWDLGGVGPARDWWPAERRSNVIAPYGRQICYTILGSVRHYAAPLSRTGKSAQSSRAARPDPNAPPEPDKPDRRINRAIVSRTVRLIVRDGHEILTRGEALKRAEYMDLDLVEVDCKQEPPVCKLMDFNKERFKDKQREKELKKKQSERRRLDDMKEVRFSTRTEQNDLVLKAQMALRLLSKGHRVKLAVIPHGNDDLEPKGRELIERMVVLLQDSSKVESGPRFERQRAWLLVRPTSVGIQGTSKKKKEDTDKVAMSATSDTEDSVEI